MLNSFLDPIKVKIPLENKKTYLLYDPAMSFLEKWKLTFPQRPVQECLQQVYP